MQQIPPLPLPLSFLFTELTRTEFGWLRLGQECEYDCGSVSSVRMTWINSEEWRKCEQHLLCSPPIERSGSFFFVSLSLSLSLSLCFTYFFFNETPSSLDLVLLFTVMNEDSTLKSIELFADGVVTYDLAQCSSSWWPSSGGKKDGRWGRRPWSSRRSCAAGCRSSCGCYLSGLNRLASSWRG